MKYLLLICVDESGESSPLDGTAFGATALAWSQDVSRRGIRLDGARLRPVTDATTVRVTDTGPLVADGPFAETKEQIAGYDIIECTDLDEAIEVAAQHPCARLGSIEVRPFWAG
jgi:hypothetical protein